MSLLTALIFIEKFVNTESAPHLLEEMTAVELFTVSLILASKYLYDVDCDHGAYNSEFADAFGMDLEELNQLEIRFLSALDWCCFVSSKEVETIFRATEFGQPVSSNAERLKRYARITRFRRTVRTHCKRRKNVASKVCHACQSVGFIAIFLRCMHMQEVRLRLMYVGLHLRLFVWKWRYMYDLDVLVLMIGRVNPACMHLAHA